MRNIALEATPYERKVDKNEIPVCTILGVRIAAVNMQWLLSYIRDRVRSSAGNLLAGDYICVSNVHTTVMSYENDDYRNIQNKALMAIPDGGPLSALGRKRGYPAMGRTPGPELMDRLFEASVELGYRHFFYGSTQETLDKLDAKLKAVYPDLQIAGRYSPPFRPLHTDEDEEIIKLMNDTEPDFIWVGLGAPKQEKWMAAHQGKLNGLMIGVGAGFDYLAGNIKRAPDWMQRNNLEWFYRLVQEPGRLFTRYLMTNTKYLWRAVVLGR